MLITGRGGHTASVLADGSVLFVGGSGNALACPSGICKSAERWDPKASDLGSPCSGDFSCASGFCVDGVCCDSPCQALCFACIFSKTSESNGVCLPVQAGTDPDNECTPLGSGTCQTSGMCDGFGFCSSKVGDICGESSCVDVTTETPPPRCNSLGACVQEPTSTCFPYVCSGAGCKNSCSSSLDCIAQAGFDCVAGKCIKAAELGSPCFNKDDCLSGFCVDGVCCDTVCDGKCKACSVTLKGFGKNGACDDVKYGSDPDDDCPSDLPSSCKFTGVCDGGGACEKFGANTVCGTVACKDGVISGLTCDGNGTCGPKTGDQSCGLYLCADASSCATSCVSNSDCAPQARCLAGACVSKLSNGTVCTTGSECDSGFCMDGVCCNAPCLETCASCATLGKLGECAPVTSKKPSGQGKSCPGEGACVGFCDGISADCILPAQGETCGASSCANGVEQPASVCDGAGQCQSLPSKDCGGFACDNTKGVCKTSCSSNNDCIPGASCNKATGICSTGENTCQDDHTVKTAGGTLQPCKGRCLAGVCSSSCSQQADCASGFTCQQGNCSESGSGGQNAGGAPASPAAPSQEEGGCGCRAVGSATSGAGWGWMLALSLLSARRRKRDVDTRRCS